MESDLEKLPGVIDVISGYAGGKGDNPTYETYAQMGYIKAVGIMHLIKEGIALDTVTRPIKNNRLL